MKLFGKRDFQVVSGKYGPRMSLFTSWSKEIERKIKRKGIVELELNPVKGWKRSDLSFLIELSDLLSFEIVDENTEDVTPIHALKKLRSLKVLTYCKTEIDFSCFPHLEKVSLEWRDGAESIFGCKTLKNVFINRCNIDSLGRFARLTELESLSLKSPKIRKIGDVSSLKKLTFLGIYYAKYLKSLEGIEVLTNLKHLEIERCNQIGNINPISYLTKIKRLMIPNNGPIESLSPLLNLANLKEVYFHESTNILDGNLALLKELPHLEDVSFQERSHYNCKWEDLPMRCSKADLKKARDMLGKREGQRLKGQRS